MNYRLNLDRMVFLSVLLWVLLPAVLLAWNATPVSSEEIHWLPKFCMNFLQFLLEGGILCIVIGFISALVTWVVFKQHWHRVLSIVSLFVFSCLCLILYGGSLYFAIFNMPMALIAPLVYCLSLRRVE